MQFPGEATAAVVGVGTCCGHSFTAGAINSASQHSLSGSLSGTRRHRVGADVFPPDVISNSNFVELRRENVSEEGSSCYLPPQCVGWYVILQFPGKERGVRWRCATLALVF